MTDDTTHLSRRKSLTEKFVDFTSANPEFVTHLESETRRYLDATGAERVGIQRLIEQVRFESDIRLKRTGVYRLDNSLAAFWSRWLMIRNPEFQGLFRTRRAPEADAWAAQLERTRDHDDEWPTAA